MHDLFKSIVEDFTSLPAKVAAATEARELASKQLTARESEIAQAVASGESLVAIANRLGLSAKTVSAHRARILGKLYKNALVDLVTYVERMRDNSNGRWPEPDMTCGVCTQGVSATTDVCALHAAKQLLKARP